MTSLWLIHDISASSIEMSPRKIARSAGNRSRAATNVSTTSEESPSYAAAHAPTTSARTRVVSTPAQNRPNALVHSSSTSYRRLLTRQATESAAGRPSTGSSGAGKSWAGNPYSVSISSASYTRMLLGSRLRRSRDCRSSTKSH